MSGAVPAAPKIYHILHVDRLPSVLADECLFSDAVMQARPASGTTIGMGTIKQRRLRLAVPCHPGTCVGDYVPFYFCPRSVMLYVIAQANHPELAYRGGQGPILTLEADFHAAVAHAEAEGGRWAISLQNAGTRYASFRADCAALAELDWTAIMARDFRPPEVKEAKQAEFLFHGRFPWSLVERIGVQNPATRQRALDCLAGARHKPAVCLTPEWYF
ncbi:DUF4433 domain-containing protein [Roseomonas alkaliterrae]|jgi:hypothetical protein|uniref:DUF4433 domain-containing protein n=1 Tax=Caldovatus aquaticus TaxID=2865671 RepID=A0ABS7F333_9PROT|nr:MULTISPECIES: DUF4433 domain-containing protein [Acetobacteraceae]MBR0676260.1 DUF4433 domain-containing protein [Neoroseomonas alkaliterrae]MBW8269984.1 DUF4433 domain-containing protein [Caldovatus aquaticus]